MRKRFKLELGFVILCLFVLSVFGQQQRTRPAQARPPASDLKVTYKMTTGGQTLESTTMIKGSRQRSEQQLGYGMRMINITQCDLKRTIQLSDTTRKYVVTPMVQATEQGTTPPTPTTPATGAQVKRGGVVTYVTTANDTGERKEMFGFNARHVKTSLSIESSPDACNPTKQRIETDGWYIDLSADLNCDLDGAAQMMSSRPRAGCQDQIRFRRQGTARTGFPLIETTTMFGADGTATYTVTKEVADLSRAPLDAALFDIPAGYTEAAGTQELYGAPAIGMGKVNDTAGQPANPTETAATPDNSGTKPAGLIRVGVVPINNKTDHSVSTDALRGRLISGIQADGIEAVPLNAESATAAEVEARAKQCDFILYTDLTALKTSTAKKLGGLFGRATGVSGMDKVDSRLEFKLFAVGETSPRLQSSTSGKEEGDEASAGTALDAEAKLVNNELRKKGRN